MRSQKPLAGLLQQSSQSSTKRWMTWIHLTLKVAVSAAYVKLVAEESLEKPSRAHLEAAAAGLDRIAATALGAASCYWAVAVLDGVAVKGKGVGDFILALCHMFLTVEWRRLKVVVSAAGQITNCSRDGDLRGAVCIMLDNGMVSSTQNVTVAHLENSQDAIRKALPNLGRVIQEALDGQKIEERRRQLEQFPVLPVQTVAGSAASAPSKPPPAASAPSKPPPATVAGSAAPSEPAPPAAQVAGSAASASPQPAPPAA